MFSIKLLIIIAFLIIWFFLYSIATFLYLLSFSFFLTLLFSPFLNKMNKYKIPDALGILIIYLFVILLIFITIFSVLPILAKQTLLFIDFMQNYLNNLAIWYKTSWIDWLWLPNQVTPLVKSHLENIDFASIFQALKDNFASISKFIATHVWDVASTWTNIIISVGSAIFNFIMVLILTFFIILERHEIKNFFYEIIPNDASKYLKKREDNIIDSLYDWLKWQFLLWVSIFLIVYISLTVLSFFWIDLKDNFTLALIAGLMEFVPYLWPIIALIPALFIAIAMGFNSFLIILILYIVIQQIENNFLVPYIMGRTLDLSPFLVLVMMSIWASIAWIVGIIIAIPLSAVLQIFVRDYIIWKKR
jgi:predicted PurR-regulated permease PerM